jgi:cysteinyl-tRNA synthetase
MRLYNTLTRKVDNLVPQSPPAVTVYTCGPTVYDYSHIGHWFNYVRMDTLIRILKVDGYDPRWVINITDVGHLTSDADEGEDKLEKGARRENKTAWEIAEFYTKDFITGMDLLNITPPDFLVKATDHIDDQINLISKLEEKGFTYTINDGVYFDTAKFPTYSEFARLDLVEQQAGARVELNKEKRNASDFALWKFSPTESKRDMEWDSPWGKGFPGWHIECSAMSMKYLGQTLDIHTGGIDHVPLHHTNEIAQSEAATGSQFARHWMHSNHVMIDGKKISKSLGNSITLEDLEGKGFSALVLRLHILESHYTSQSKFSFDSLQAAKNRLQDIYAMAALRWQPRRFTHDASTFALEDVPKQLKEILTNDLDTPRALALLSQVSTQLQAVHIEEDMVDHFENMLIGLDQMLGLRLMEIANINPTQQQLIEQRERARQSKDFTEADAIRQQLLDQNLGLRDADDGPIWYRVL